MDPAFGLSGTSIRTAVVDRFVVATFGGTASKTLVRGILNQPPPGISPVNLVRRHHSHKRVPFAAVPDGVKVIYVYGDPAHSIASFFRRAANEDPDDPHPRHANFLARHCRNIEGDVEKITVGYTLEEFLSGDDDPFRLADHFHAWLTAKVPYPILFVRYEAMWDHVEAVFDFVGLSRAEAASFPEKRATYVERNRKYDEPLARLRHMYARLIAEMEALPPLFLRSPAAG
ncbi:MAG TPA: sulfotransferase domain-containing protein [Polyangia bacterium]